MKTVRIALLQMPVIPGRLAENLNTAKRMILSACNKGCDIAILPECCDFGWADESVAQSEDLEAGAAAFFLAGLAQQHGIYMVAGIVERKGDSLYNTAVMFSPKGERLGSHHKISLVRGVEDCIYASGTELRVFDTEFGRIGLPICADNLMGSVCIGESMALMGAKMLLSPCSWAVSPERLNAPYGEEWHQPYRYLSEKYGLLIAGVSNVGPVLNGAWAGYSCIGNSIAYGPGGKQLAVLPYGEQAEAIHMLQHTL